MLADDGESAKDCDTSVGITVPLGLDVAVPLLSVAETVQV